MTHDQWETIRYFKSHENFGDPARMSYVLLLTLDNFREYVNQPIIIHCGYEDRGNDSYHCKGMAVDCHIKNMNLYDAYMAATRFAFYGIGVYPWWNKPGLHLDVRPIDKLGHRSYWGSTGAGEYCAISSDFVSEFLV